MNQPGGAIPVEVALSNPRADRVRRVKGLLTASARRREGLFLAEGPGAVRAAVEHVGSKVRDVYLSASVCERDPSLIRAAGESGVRVQVGTDEVLHAMSPDGQGAIAVVERIGTTLEEVPRRARLVAVLSDVRDPGNAGTSIRSAAAAGADAVVLAGLSVDAANPKVVRASAGALFVLPVIEEVSLADAVDALRGRGLRILAADVAGTVDFGRPGADREALSQPTAWVFGNEAWGLGEEALSQVDQVVRIPLFGEVESLNLAAAVVLCLYSTATAQREASR